MLDQGIMATAIGLARYSKATVIIYSVQDSNGKKVTVAAVKGYILPARAIIIAEIDQEGNIKEKP